jgi:hypothetical protein
MNVLSNIPSFFEKRIFKKEKKINIVKIRHNCLQYKPELTIFYFHILNIIKFD